MDEKNTSKQKKSNDIVNNITVGYGQSELVQRFGEASSQIRQAYSGKRYDSLGNELLHKGRSLEKINTYKVNPDYAEQNLKQQSGFAAELLEESNRNRDAILQGSDIQRRTTDGIGKTNDTQYDLVDVDPSGNVSNPSQMKFLGVDKNGKYSVIEKLAKDKSWDRYDQPIDIPKDQYESALKYANDEADKLLEQAKKLREQGKIEKALEKEELSEKYRTAGKRIRPSSVTEEDAMLARTNPKKYVAREMLKDAHSAGKEAAQGAILVGGVISLGQNICAVYSGEETIEDAVKNVTITTAKAGATAYGVGSVGSAIKSVMHTSKNEVVRKLGTTNLPTAIVTSTLEISRIIKSYAKGEITDSEAFAQLGKSGVGSLAASYGAAVGTLLLPGIGTMVGGMVGYMVSSTIYDSCLQILVEADLAKEDYERTKEMCEAAREYMQMQRKEFELCVEKFLSHRQQVFSNSVPIIMDSIDSLDTTDFTEAINALAVEFGRELQFKSFEEFDSFMQDDEVTFIF